MDALAAGRSARHRDEHLLASMLHVLAGFAFELLDVHLARVVEREFEQIRWSEDLSVIHSYVLQARSSSALLAGDPHRAWTLLGEALAVTSEQAPLIHAHVTFASLHRVMGDSFAPRQHLTAACALIGQVVWSESTQDGRMALLEYAAEAARLNEGSAAQALMRYHSARKAVDSLASLEADPRAEALERHASALVARMNDKGATDQLRAAAGCWAKIGYHMRHGEALLDLHETQASADLLRQVAAIAKSVPRSWLNDEVKRRGLGSDEGSVLSAAERRVMAAICEGKSARQIAGELGRSVSTINNQTRAIYDALGVRSRAALIANYGAQAARSSATL
jgi:DNA-binding CsgD family transcriptional regulator